VGGSPPCMGNEHFIKLSREHLFSYEEFSAHEKDISLLQPEIYYLVRGSAEGTYFFSIVDCTFSVDFTISRSLRTWSRLTF
jgi:hypothetical protein